MSLNPYKVLGLKTTATEQEIKQAYRRLAMQHHPDRGGSAQKFQEIQEAYSALQKSANFNQNNDDYESVQDIFRRHFSKANGFYNQETKNPDVTIRVNCELKEANQGFSRTINYHLPGEGQQTKTVNFPPGSYHGIRIRYAGEGGKLVDSLNRGDLYCELQVNPHPFWQPDFKTQNVVGEFTITLREALIGTVLLVTDVDGQEIQVSVPAGTQPGAKLRLKGRGLRKFRETAIGDAYIKINVNIPALNERDLMQPLIDLIV